MQKNSLAVLILLAALGASCKSPVRLPPDQTALPHGELWSEGTLRIVFPFTRLPVSASKAELHSERANRLFQLKLFNDSDNPIRWAPESLLWQAELFNADGTRAKTKRRRHPQILTPIMPTFQELGPHQDVQLNMQQTLSLPRVFDTYKLPPGLYYLVITYNPLQIWNTASPSADGYNYIYRNQGIFTNKVVSAPIPLLIQ